MNKFIKYNDESLNVIGKKVRKYREANNWSLTDLSNKLMLLGIDIPKSSLQNILKNTEILKFLSFFVAICLFSLKILYIY